MPRPLNERQRLEQELAELPGQIIAAQDDLAATAVENRARRERIDWQIRSLRKPMAEVEKRLASASVTPSP